MAELLEADCEEQAPKLAGPFADLMTSSLQAISWLEIAKHIVSDLEPTDSGESEDE